MIEARYLGLTANELAKVASELESENAKLRRFANLDAEDIDTMSCLVDGLRAENDRLRELARKTWHIAMSERCTLDSVRAYDSMSMDPEEYVKAIDTEIDKIRARMQELGIEVR